MAGNHWVKFTKADANLTSKIADTFTNSRTRSNNVHMLLLLYWSRDSRDDYATTMGAGQLSDYANVTRKQAQTFLANAEKAGWLVRVGEKKTRQGVFVRRKFSDRPFQETVLPDVDWLRPRTDMGSHLGPIGSSW